MRSAGFVLVQIKDAIPVNIAKGSSTQPICNDNSRSALSTCRRFINPETHVRGDLPDNDDRLHSHEWEGLHESGAARPKHRLPGRSRTPVAILFQNVVKVARNSEREKGLFLPKEGREG